MIKPPGTLCRSKPVGRTRRTVRRRASPRSGTSAFRTSTRCSATRQKRSRYRSRPTFDVAEYLSGEATKDLLRFSTAGSVDDGKSTLIGRLLYDTQSVYDDQVRSIEGQGTTAPGVLDLALLTDGLRAEREQGITIDVAYRYFSTATPQIHHRGHARTRAVHAQHGDGRLALRRLAIVLVDARKGVLVQSRRHACITACWACGTSCRGEQDGPGRLRRGDVCRDRTGVSRLFREAAASVEGGARARAALRTSKCAGRGERRHAAEAHALVQGAIAAGAAGNSAPRPRARPKLRSGSRCSG